MTRQVGTRSARQPPTRICRGRDEGHQRSGCAHPVGMLNTIPPCPEDSGTLHVPEQPKAPADSLGRGRVISSTGSPTPNGGLATPLSLMRCLGHRLRQRGAQILPGKSSHGWSAPEGGRGACSASASGSHLGRRSGARSGRGGEGKHRAVKFVPASASRRRSGSPVSRALPGKRTSLLLRIELNLDDDSRALVAADVGDAAAFLVAHAQLDSRAAT